MKVVWGESTAGAASLALPSVQPIPRFPAETPATGKVTEFPASFPAPTLPASVPHRPAKGISKYWPRADRSLDVLSLSLAGLRDGIGPILTLYLVREIHLNPVALSWVVAAPGIAAMVSQAPIGFIYDRIADKRNLLMIGATLLAASCFAIGCVSSIAALIALQLIFGFANCLLSAGVPALSVAAAGADGLGRRLGRNEVFSKIGNFSVLGAVSYLTQMFSVSWLFWSIPVLAAPVVGAARAVPKAREASAKASKRPRRNFINSIRFALRSRPVCILVGLAFLYELAASAQLMTFEQSLVRSIGNSATATVASAMVLTQIVISSVIFLLGRTKISPYNFIMIGFAVIGIRALVFAANFGIPGFYVAQALDGISAAIALTIPMRIIAMRDQKDFNMTSGLVGTCVSIGSTVSLLSAGYIIASYDYETTFFALGAVALVGFVLSVLGRPAFLRKAVP